MRLAQTQEGKHTWEAPEKNIKINKKKWQNYWLNLKIEKEYAFHVWILKLGAAEIAN